MAAASSFQNAFQGLVSQDEFTQQVDFQYTTVGSASLRSLVTRRAKRQVFLFQGLSATDAASTVSQTVTDSSGVSYTVPLASSFTDGSTGSKVFETESVAVSRRRLSPGLWEVRVDRTGSEYYLGSTKIISGPTWL